MIQIYMLVRTVVDGEPIHEVAGKPACWEATGVMKPPMKPNLPSAAPAKPSAGEPNRFKALDENGAAEVTLGVEEKMSGPEGTYSSVAVRLEVKARCGQSEAAVRAASQVLYDVAAEELDKHMPAARKLLLEHLNA